MSKYNHYAKRYDDIARSVFNDYKKVSADYETAKAAYENHPYRHAVGLIPAENAASLAQAKVDMLKAEVQLNAAKINLNDAGNRIREIQKELNEALDRDYRINPADVNMATIEILKSGMLRPEEYGKMIADNQSNPTMCRMIGQYALQAYSTATDREARAHLIAAVHDSRNIDGSNYKQTFDDLCLIYDKCVKHPALFDRWDEIASSVETF